MEMKKIACVILVIAVSMTVAFAHGHHEEKASNSFLNDKASNSILANAKAAATTKAPAATTKAPAPVKAPAPAPSGATSALPMLGVVGISLFSYLAFYRH